MITAAVKRVELDSHMIAVLNPQTMCQSLIALNLAGVDYSKEEFCTYASELCKGDNLSKLSSEERNVLDTLCRTVQNNSALENPAITKLAKALNTKAKVSSK